jgi:hypothetical protein
VFVQKMLSVNNKGAIAELAIAKQAAALDIPVLWPLIEHGRYDLALEIGDEFCASSANGLARFERSSGSISVPLAIPRRTAMS